MNLETQISLELWGAIASSYQAENYTNAIKDAMSVVTAVLRDKSGVDGDGFKLVAQTLGHHDGQRPKIQVNKLQTETERNIQKGLMFTLQGMYLMIRNPRSHEQLDDPKSTADAIIIFINYLLEIVGKSTYSFTTEKFIQQVKDPFFVKEQEYAEGIVKEIPVRRRLETAITVYRTRSWGIAENLELSLKAILALLSEQEIEEFASVVSDELKLIDQTYDASLHIKLLPHSLWLKVDRLSRMRLENILLSSLERATYVFETDQSSETAYTWITRIVRDFISKGQLKKALITKLAQVDFEHQNAIARWFLDELPGIFKDDESGTRDCIKNISNAVKMGNEYFVDRLEMAYYVHFPENWTKLLRKELKELRDPDRPEDTPGLWLTKFEPKPNPAKPKTPEVGAEDDDIPF